MFALVACGGDGTTNQNPDAMGPPPPDAPETLPDAGPPQMAAEIENNGDELMANAIPAPTTTRGTLVTGKSDRVNVLGRRVIDVDVFKFVADAPGGLEVTVTPNASSGFVPSVSIKVGELVFRNDNAARGASARVEGYVPRAGQTVYILVDDARAGQNSVAPGVPADTYSALITLKVVPVTPLGPAPILSGAAGSVDQAGKLTLYSFELTAAGEAWLDLDLTAGAALAPRLQVFRPDGVVMAASTGDLPRFVVPDLPLAPGTYQLAISDFTGDSGGARGFAPRVVFGRTPSAVADDGSHTSSGTAIVASADFTVISANLAAGGQIWIRLDAGAQGSGARVTTAAATASGAEVDTSLTLIDSNGATEIATVEAGSFGSLMANLAFETSDDRWIKVTGAMPATSGAILVFVERKSCISAAGTGAPVLFVNEIYPRNNPAVDANGDSTASETQDRFVELRNGSRQPAAADGQLVRTEKGVRYRFACADEIAPGAGLAIFSGCTGATCANSRRIANASPGNPYAADADGLGITAAGGEVMLLAPSGELIDRVPFGAAADNKPFVSRAGTTCDKRLGTGSTACSAGHTAGVSSTGAAFSAPGAPSNDTCGSALAVTSGAILHDQTLDGLNPDYDLSDTMGACARPPGIFGYGGNEAVYSITIPGSGRLTVTVDPYPSFLSQRYNGAIFITSSCADSGMCRTLGDQTAYGPETVSYTNPTASPLPVYILVDDADGSALEYQLRVNLD